MNTRGNQSNFSEAVNLPRTRLRVASRAGESRRGPSFSEQRNRERARLLLSICRAFDRHVEHGHALAPQFKRLARRWSGRVYRCDPSRSIRFSAERLRKIYYGCWLRSGRKPESLSYRYGANVPRFTLSLRNRRKLRVLLTGCTSFAALRTALFPRASTRPCDKTFRRCFTASERQHLHQVFALRRAIGAETREFARWAAHPERTFHVGGPS
jgi:hypothetical protein